MDKRKYGVHKTHCCIKHGCKYGDSDCPVVSGEIKQEYTCEVCDDEGITSVDELFDCINISKITKDFFEKIEKWEGSAGYLIEDKEYINGKAKILKFIEKHK